MRLTFEGDNFAAIWGPGEESITFSSNRAGACDLFGLRPDSGAAPDVLVASEFDKVAGAWSPDRSTLAYTEYHPETGANIWLFDKATGLSREWLCSRFNEYAPAFSPDGAFLAYTSDQTGRPEVYVAKVSRETGTWQISTDGGAEPVWLPDGRGLVYRNGDRLMAVDIRLGPEQAGVPRTLFEGRYVPGTLTGLANYENGAVAGTFLMVAEDEAPRPGSLAVAVNWFTELAAKD
jgi:Tol biopolymer transport system component